MVSIHAQEGAAVHPVNNPPAGTPPSPWRPGFLDDMSTRQLTWGIALGNSLAVGLYGKTHWWQDGFSGRFRTVDEGWFGQHTYSGGADKLGHFYMNYVGARLFTRAFEWAGNDAGRSLQLAGLMMLGTFTAVEVLDGFSREWSFSKEDMAMNVAGVGAAYLLEKNPALDRVVDLRFRYARARGGSGNFNPFGDYSGQTYLLVVKASGIPALRSHPVLRYLELAAGYGTRGYANGDVNAGDGKRNVYVGISLNLSELLNRTAFRNAKGSRTQWWMDTTLEFVQVPGTAALARHELQAD